MFRPNCSFTGKSAAVALWVTAAALSLTWLGAGCGLTSEQVDALVAQAVEDEVAGRPLAQDEQISEKHGTRYAKKWIRSQWSSTSAASPATTSTSTQRRFARYNKGWVIA